MLSITDPYLLSSAVHFDIEVIFLLLVLLQVGYNYVEVVEKLISFGADVNAVDEVSVKLQTL